MIKAIVKDGSIPYEYKVIDLKGKYIMPGLINMHVHLAGSGKPQKKQRDNEKLVKTLLGNPITKAIAYKMVKDFAKTELISGVTTIRTVGGLADFDTRARDEIYASEVEQYNGNVYDEPKFKTRENVTRELDKFIN